MSIAPLSLETTSDFGTNGIRYLAELNPLVSAPQKFATPAKGL